MNDIFGRNQELMELPRRLGNYELSKLLGQGGMGEVYLAHNIELREPAAVKLLPKHLANDASFVNRFREEARKLRRLQHSHIVQAHDFGRDGNDFYLVMECIDGGDLQDVIDANPEGVEPSKALDYLLQISAAVREAHKTTVHRDLSPNNILLTKEGDVKVSDFGLSEVVGEDYARSLIEKSVTLSQVGIAETLPADNSRRAANIVGKVRYMSPQVTRGEPSDKRNDIYAIGIMLYDLVTGRSTGMVRSIRKEKPKLDPRWQDIFDKCTVDDIEARYQSVEELESDLKALKQKAKGKGGLKRVLFLATLALATGAAYFTQEKWMPHAEPYITKANEQIQQWLKPKDVPVDSGSATPNSSNKEQLAPSKPVSSGSVGIQLPSAPPSGSRFVLLSPKPHGFATEYSSPSSIALPVSNSDYTLRFEHPDYQPATFTVPGTSGSHAARFPMEQIRVANEYRFSSSPDGATVYLNESPIGQTPLSHPIVFERSSAAQAYQAVKVRFELESHDSVEMLVQEASPTNLPTAELTSQRTPRKLLLTLAGNIEMQLTFVEAGQGMIGSPEDELGRIAHSETQRRIEIEAPFYIGVTEVTQAQYKAVTGNNPSFFIGSSRPVEQVVYKDLNSEHGFIAKLNDFLEANGYAGWTADLPTNEEWEFATRAGTETTFYNGQDISKRGRDPALDQLAVYLKTITAPVSSKEPNPWGLYDTLGNVFEWTKEGELRGGSFKQQATTSRPAYRLLGKSDRKATDKDANQFGLRIVIRPPN